MFGDAGIKAVLKELQQIHDRGVLEPTDQSKMTLEEKKAALAYLMLIKEKSSGVIKGRGCADGQKQRLYTNKEDSSSPTVAIESVFLTSVIDSKENHDVATIDVPGAFMQADMEDTVHMKLEGTMAELLINLALDVYKKFAYKHNGKTMLYVLLKRHYMALSKLLCCFGSIFHLNCRSGILNLTHMTHAWQTKVSMVSSVQLYGMWMTLKSRIVIQPLSLM